MLPSADITKGDGNTGSVRPSAAGILAIVAASPSGNASIASTYTRPAQMVTDFGKGRLTSFGDYVAGITKKPVVLVKAVASTAGAYSAFTNTGAGTATPASGGTEPVDEYDAYVIFKVGGALGTTGITYQYSLDGGSTLSAVQSLGTGLTIVIPNTGITITLGTSTQTILAAQTIAFKTTPPLPQTTDLTAALEALRVTGSPWDAALIDGVATAAVIAQVQAWLIALEAMGKYRTAVVTLRRRNAGETEAAYAAALAAIMATVDAPNVLVCADVGDAVDKFQSVLMPRPTGLFAAAVGESIDIATDIATTDRGAITNCFITDVRNNPKYHDEFINPGLDDLRITTLRTFDDLTGVYITNPNLASAPGSDFVFWQHMRVMNRACEIAHAILVKQLSRGVLKSPKVGPNGARYIAEEEASSIDALVNGALTQPMKGRVTDYAFAVSRSDDISPNSGATITAATEIVSLAYIKKFAVTNKFVKSITVSQAA